ncbi:MAG: hypothetical protein J0G96_03945 [Flavobacteriia bacterium]|nr:hypothetical protein [Flavobacteriia bacterium]OJX37652.1 MAG: hypothetical protein BGO87_11315 [Flavobacteriia bacterium 40-80]
MKNKFSLLTLAAIAVFVLFVFIRCNSSGANKDYLSSNITLPTTLCIANPSWFPHSQTPPPEEGKNSPFAKTTSTNEIFHQWSWQKFLWLTKPASERDNTPLFLRDKEIDQIDTLMNIISPDKKLVLNGYTQAGSDHAMLKTNPGYGGKSDTVYYSIHMNREMYKHTVRFTNIIKSDTSRYLDNTFAFPVGSLELKAAWVSVDAIPAFKQRLYYITTASISGDKGKTYTNKRVALIGMHIVGVVENHPEFIWATFEHDDIAPNYNWKDNLAESKSEKLLFKSGSTSGIDGIDFNTVTKYGKDPYHVFDLFQYGVPRQKGGAFMETSSSGEVNFNNIDGINKCVKENLKDVWKNYFYNGSIWLDMDGKDAAQQKDLICRLGKDIQKATPGSYARGSLNCSNVTMESFTQTFKKDINNINAGNLANCFSCHSGTIKKDSDPDLPPQYYRSPLYVSHIFQGYLQEQIGYSKAKIEQFRTAEEKQILFDFKNK